MYYLVTRLCCADDDGDWCDEDGSPAVTYIVLYTNLDARCDKLALVQDLCVMKTYCVTYSVFYTKLDARCDKLALVQDLG